MGAVGTGRHGSDPAQRLDWALSKPGLVFARHGFFVEEKGKMGMCTRNSCPANYLGVKNAGFAPGHISLLENTFARYQNEEVIGHG